MAQVELESVSGKLRGLRKRDLSVEISFLEGERKNGALAMGRSDEDEDEMGLF